MKIRIELDDTLREAELVLRCSQMTDALSQIHRQIQHIAGQLPEMAFYKQNEVHYISLSDILFFETDTDMSSSNTVYAHTKTDAYRVKLRLYELENILPAVFVRIAKCTIVNVLHVQSIARNITAASIVAFHGSHKQVCASRRYYKNLLDCLHEQKTLR